MIFELFTERQDLDWGGRQKADILGGERHKEEGNLQGYSIFLDCGVHI